MSARRTRGAAAREAAAMAAAAGAGLAPKLEGQEDGPRRVSGFASPPADDLASTTRTETDKPKSASSKRSTRARNKITTEPEAGGESGVGLGTQSTEPAVVHKRKRNVPGINTLPHGLGTVVEAEAKPAGSGVDAANQEQGQGEEQGEAATQKRGRKSRKVAGAEVVKNDDHLAGMGEGKNGNDAVGEEVVPPSTPKRGRRKATNARKAVKAEVDEDLVKTKGGDDEDQNEKKTRKRPAKKIFKLGVTPFPDYLRPTPEECQTVHDLLTEAHGEVKAPEVMPEPSLTVTGCGEVPSVIDALIRTYLSSATTFENSAKAFTGLIKKFGVMQEGIGKGSADYNKIRQADVKDIYLAIKSGGLGDVKSRHIKKILDEIYEAGLARRDALIAAKKEGTPGPAGMKDETAEEVETDIACADQNVLSLEHVKSMPYEEAMNELTKFDGIGIKTASCVSLFCLGHPSFAVDTHVHRLCNWLGWLPSETKFKKLHPDHTFAHCDVRVPNHLKYGLHQLFIFHGQTCLRCRDDTFEGCDGWEEEVCPIEHMVTRHGKRKRKDQVEKKKRGKTKREEIDEDQDDDMGAEENEDEDLQSDEEMDKDEEDVEAF